MDIVRRGAQRNKGITTIASNLAPDIVWWDKRSKSIVINALDIPHRDGHTKHNYEIRLTLADFAALLTELGAGISESEAPILRKELRRNIPALVKLLACATGLVPLPLREEES